MAHPNQLNTQEDMSAPKYTDSAKTHHTMKLYKSAIRQFIQEHNHDQGSHYYMHFGETISPATLTPNHLQQIIPLHMKTNETHMQYTFSAFAMLVAEFYGVNAHDVDKGDLQSRGMSSNQEALLKKYYPTLSVLKNYKDNEVQMESVNTVLIDDSVVKDMVDSEKKAMEERAKEKEVTVEEPKPVDFNSLVDRK